MHTTVCTRFTRRLCAPCQFPMVRSSNGLDCLPSYTTRGSLFPSLGVTTYPTCAENSIVRGARDAAFIGFVTRRWRSPRFCLSMLFLLSRGDLAWSLLSSFYWLRRRDIASLLRPGNCNNIYKAADTGFCVTCRSDVVNYTAFIVKVSYVSTFKWNIFMKFYKKWEVS